MLFNKKAVENIYDKEPMNYRGIYQYCHPRTAMYNTNCDYLPDSFKSNFTVGEAMQAR